MKALWKTTIVIWSEYNGETCELSDLAREAEQGSAYCSRLQSQHVKVPEADTDWDGTEFFDNGD